jgi:Zn-dependent alcohol dehydrogenase
MQFPIKTEALVMEDVGCDFELTPIIIEELRPDEVLIEMKYSGICHTVSGLVSTLQEHGSLAAS